MHSWLTSASNTCERRGDRRAGGELHEVTTSPTARSAPASRSPRRGGGGTGRRTSPRPHAASARRGDRLVGPPRPTRPPSLDSMAATGHANERPGACWTTATPQAAARLLIGLSYATAVRSRHPDFERGFRWTRRPSRSTKNASARTRGVRPTGELDSASAPDRSRPVGRRIGADEAEGAAVADPYVTICRPLRQQGHRAFNSSDARCRGAHRPNALDHPVRILPEVGDADIDHEAGPGQPQLHRWNQIVAAGEQLRHAAE